jgi:hypothetical protein
LTARPVFAQRSVAVVQRRADPTEPLSIHPGDRLLRGDQLRPVNVAEGSFAGLGQHELGADRLPAKLPNSGAGSRVHLMVAEAI